MDRRKYERRLKSRDKVTTGLLLHIALWSFVVVLLVSTVNFFFTYERSKTSVINSLQHDINSRLERTQLFLAHVERNATNLSAEFLRRYTIFMQYPEWVERFDNWSEETSPGVLRLKPDFFHGTLFNEEYFSGMTTFVGPRATAITDELKLRILAAQYTLNDLGPAWDGLVTNTHFSLPENVLIQFSHEIPWGLLADKSLVITDFSVVKSTLQSENPARLSGWTGLYHDTSAGYWTLTYQQPVDYQGRHLVNSSFDVRLDWLLNNLTARPKPNVDHFVLNDQGEIVGASNISFETLRVPELGSASGYDDEVAAVMFETLQAGNLLTHKRVVTGVFDGRVLIINRIENARWWYITSYPTHLIRTQALLLPIQLSLGGIFLVLITLLIVYWLINRDVSHPLRHVDKVASMVDAKNYKDVVSQSAKTIKTRGEVNMVLQAFRTVAARFIRAQEQLEKKVKHRTAELAEANKQLDQLAHLDGLTALMNRRSFDRDLKQVIAKGQPAWLILGDIDDFKLYNDNYGHEAGDAALQKYSLYLRERFHGRAYRYGGEELAVILPITDKPTQLASIQNMLDDIYHLNIEHLYSRHGRKRLSISFGVAPIYANDTPEQAIRRADEQLYKAKHAGGNLVHFDDDV